MTAGDARPAASESTQDIALGFHEAHRRVSAATTQLFQTVAQARALAEVLVAKGLVEIEELERSQQTVEQDLAETFDHEGLGVSIAAAGPDKYDLGDLDVQIDCASRLPLCHAACCRLRFPLSEQDIHEGVVQWQLDRPYLNRLGADGYCVHCSAETRSCQVYASRPAVCRTYDCRADTRIWLDFEGRVPNPDLP
jgi:hypothetical protein